MMAGQIHEPIGFNFQADSVHSGSVSFGRFANEPLLWERRSSFSHNRILEEVERCSKHGIVNEMKAYFEAQFRRKAFLRQCLLDEQNGMQYETNEKDNQDLGSLKEDYEFVQGNKDNGSFDSSVNRGNSEDYDYAQDDEEHVHLYETSDASNDIEEREMIDYQVEGGKIQMSDPLKYPSSDSLGAKAKVDAIIGTHADQQTVIDCTYSRCDSREHDVEVEGDIDIETCNNDEDCKAIVLRAINPKAEKEPDAAPGHTDLYPKIMAATEPCATEPSVKFTCTQRQGLSEVAKKPSRNVIRMVKSSAQETKTFQQSKINLSSADKWPRSTNPKHLLTQSPTSVSKSLSGSKSVYTETRTVKVTKSQVTTMTKDPPIRHQTPNRAEKVAAPNASGLKTSLTSVKSAVRAEKRKETLTRTEQTSLTRKTEINRNSARTQEKTDVEIKQIRRCSILNAKSMPSSFNEAGRLEVKSKDVVANNAQKIPSITRTKVVARPSMHLKAESGPSKSPSQVSTVTSYLGQNPMKTSAVSSFGKRSTLPTGMRNALRTKEMADGSKDEKSKKLIVSRNAEATKGKSNIVASLIIKATTSKCTTRKATETVRPQKMSRPAPKKTLKVSITRNSM